MGRKVLLDEKVFPQLLPKARNVSHQRHISVCHRDDAPGQVWHTLGWSPWPSQSLAQAQQRAEVAGTGTIKGPGRRGISDVGLIELCECFLSYAGEYSCPGVNPGLTGIDLWIPRIPSGVSGSNWWAPSCWDSLVIGRIWSNCGC